MLGGYPGRVHDLEFADKRLGAVPDGAVCGGEATGVRLGIIYCGGEVIKAGTSFWIEEEVEVGAYLEAEAEEEGIGKGVDHFDGSAENIFGCEL